MLKAIQLECLTYCSTNAPLSNVIIEEKLEQEQSQTISTHQLTVETLQPTALKQMLSLRQRKYII